MLFTQVPLFGVYHVLVSRANAQERQLTQSLRAAGGLDAPARPQLKREGGSDPNPFL